MGKLMEACSNCKHFEKKEDENINYSGYVTCKNFQWRNNIHGMTKVYAKSASKCKKFERR